MVDVIAFDLWDTLIYLDEGWKTFTQLKPFIPAVARDKNFWREKVKPLYLFREQESPDTFLNDLNKELSIDLRSLSGRLHSRLEYDLKNTRLYGDTLLTLGECKKRFKLAIISNQCSFYVPSFYTLGLDNYFDFVLFSCNLGYGKPDERIYKKLVEISQTAPKDILIIGDNKREDYQRPIELGFNALHLTRNEASSKDSIRNLSEILERL